MADISRQVKWQRKCLEDGRCYICGKKRGRDGTSHHCRRCSDLRNERQRRKRLEAADATH